MTAMNADVRRMIDRPNYAHIASLMPDGGPHSVPVWIDREGDALVVLTGPGSRKARNLQRDPRVAISITDADNPFVSALIRGHVAERVEGDRAWEIIDRISRKYIGQAYPVRNDRIVLVIEPDHAQSVTFG